MPEIKEQEKTKEVKKNQTKKTIKKSTTTTKTNNSKKSPSKTASTSLKKKSTVASKPKESKTKIVTSNVESKEPKKIIIEEIDLEKEPALKEPIVIPEKKEKEDNLYIDDENNKGVVFLLIIMIIIFGLGVFYVYDYYNKTEDKNKNDINVINEDKIDLQGSQESSKTSTTEENSNIETITLADYQQKNKKKEKMIVIIASKYCGGCKTYEPVINRVLAKKNMKAYKIDVSEITTQEDKTLFKSLFEVSVTPTTFIIENGTSKASFMGYSSEEATSSWIDKNY